MGRMTGPMTSHAESDRLAKLLALHGQEPDDGFVLYGLAQECQKLGRLEEALGWYDRAIVADPKQCYAFFHKAKALDGLRRRADALSTLRDGLARARSVGDRHAASEIEALIDEFE
jgi:tetratricopeptide (TPR) repeat protein